MRPELPEGTTTRAALLALGALAAAKAVGLVALMTALATALASLAGGGALDLAPLLAWGGMGAMLRAGAAWGSKVVAQRAAIGVKEEQRAALLRRRLASAGADDADAGAEAALASRGLDQLDPYFRDYLPALVSTAVIPPIVGVWILGVDWVSALILVLTIPLVPLFMVLIGLHTQERVGQAQAGLDRLSHHLSELAAGLPVLVGLRRDRQQREALRDVAERYRLATMATLRTAFMSSFALELIATLSVAVVAVFIGVRLVYGGMDLRAGLIALMLAPECFASLRELGSAHHASEDGLAALRRVKAVLAKPMPGRPLGGEGPETAVPSDGPVALADASSDAAQVALGAPVARVSSLLVTRAEGRECVGPVDLELRAGRLLILRGPSGSGKSTVLAALAGTLRDGAASSVAADVTGLDDARIAYAPQAPVFASETAREELELVGEDAMDALLALLPERLADAPLSTLSPGERRRVGVARACAKAAAILHTGGTPLVLLDEPTAHLDRSSAARVLGLLDALRRSGAALAVATHDADLAALADDTLTFAEGGVARFARGSGHEQLSGLERGAKPAAARPSFAPLVEEPAAPGEKAGRPAAEIDAMPAASAATSARETWAAAWRVLPVRSPRLWFAVLLGSLSVLAASALSGLSGWLIVQASYQPPMLHLMVAIVGVRFFGLARAALRYRERLSTHDVVLRWTTSVRVRLWDALGSDARGWGRLTRPGGALGTLVAEVDELRDALPRVLVPIPAAVLACLGTSVAVGIVLPAALPATLACCVLALLLIPWLVTALERRAAAHLVAHGALVARSTGALYAAAPDLAANGLGGAALRRFAESEAASAAHLRRDAIGQGAGRALASLLSAAGAIAALVTAAGADARLLALVVLLLLALDEPLGQLADASRNVPVLTHMLRRLAPWLGAADTAERGLEPDAEQEPRRAKVDAVRADGLAAGYDRRAPAVFSGVSGEATPGALWAVTGPSGSGKSTFVATLLGFLAPREGSAAVRAVDEGGWVTVVGQGAGEDVAAAPGASLGEGESAGELRDAAHRGVAWCPQDGYVFDSTLRGNLALGRPRSEAPGEAELVAALERVGLGPWFRALPQGLDTTTGAGGSRLSGGQRQRLAVARTLVAGAGVVILDEPTAHLGADEGAELVRDVLVGAGPTALLLVTHDAGLASHADVLSVLPGTRRV